MVVVVGLGWVVDVGEGGSGVPRGGLVVVGDTNVVAEVRTVVVVASVVLDGAMVVVVEVLVVEVVEDVEVVAAVVDEVAVVTVVVDWSDAVVSLVLVCPTTPAGIGSSPESAVASRTAMTAIKATAAPASLGEIPTIHPFWSKRRCSLVPTLEKDAKNAYASAAHRGSAPAQVDSAKSDILTVRT